MLDESDDPFNVHWSAVHLHFHLNMQGPSGIVMNSNVMECVPKCHTTTSTIDCYSSRLNISGEKQMYTLADDR